MVKYNLQQSSSHYKILGTRWVIRSLLNAEDPQILGAKLLNLLDWMSWFPGFVHRCIYIDNFQVFMTRVLRNIAFWVVTTLSCVDTDVSVEHPVSIVRVGRSGAVLTLKWSGLGCSKHRLHVEVKKDILHQKTEEMTCIFMYIGLGNRVMDFRGSNLSR